MMRETMVWQWHQLDYMYANHLHLTPDRLPCQHLITQFLRAGCSCSRPTNSIKALKAIGCWFVGLLSPASSLQHVDIAEQIDVAYPQQSTVKTVHMRVCISLCTNVIHSTAVWELLGGWGFDPLVHVFNPPFCHLCWPWGQRTPLVRLA